MIHEPTAGSILFMKGGIGEDPHELKNLHENPIHAQTREKMTGELRRLQREL